jgi:DNA-binding NarL/FixJ family response regulator
VLAVGDSACGADILHAVRVGITSIVSVDTDLSALPQACRGAVAGIPYLSPALLRTLLRYMSGNESPDTRASSRLTARETQILRHLTVGSSQSDISVQLRISSRTVKYHLGNLYQKLGVHSQAEAIVCAYRDGLVT